MAMYYRRDGTPYRDVMEWAADKKAHTPEMKRVAETTLPWGGWVSTVWIGLNHQFGDGPPLIFETMCFHSKDNLDELDCERYSTEEEAVAGHEAMVARWLMGPDGELA